MRRSRLDVIYSFLLTLEGGAMKPTPLMYKTNLSHELFIKYLSELESAGLIMKINSKNSTKYTLTNDGVLYLKEYRQFLKFSASFGL